MTEAFGTVGETVTQLKSVLDSERRAWTVQHTMDSKGEEGRPAS